MLCNSGCKLRARGVMWKKYYSRARPVGHNQPTHQIPKKVPGKHYFRRTKYSGSSNNNSMADG